MNLILRLFKRYEFNQKMKLLKKNGLQLGKNCSIARNAIIDESHSWLIEIGDNVTITSGVTILAHDASMKRTTGYAKIGKVKISDGVFIGVNTIILPGVHIGKNSIVGAGSVVCRNIPENKVFVGNPAKEVLSASAFIEKQKDRQKSLPIFTEEYTTRRKLSQKLKQEMIEKLDGGIGFVE